MRRMKMLRPGRLRQNWAVKSSLTLLLTGLITLAQSQIPVNPSVPKALYLLDTEQSRKALAEMEQAVSANPADASLLYYLGYVHLKMGDRAKALATFEKGIQLNEKEALNYAGKGHISLLENKVEDAKLQFDKALTMTKSKNPAVLKAIAEAYLIDNKYSVDAINLLNKAKSVADTDAEVQILLGDAYLLQNNGGLSVSSYERAAAMKPTLAKPHYKAGLVFERSKNTELALENFKKAIAVDPKYTLAYKELGEVYYLLGAKEAANAVKAAESYLALTEKPEAYQYQYAFFLFMAKEFTKANEVFKKVADAPDVKATTLRFYAVSLFEVGDFQKSVEVFEKYFVKAKPEEIEANDFVYYGKALLKLKQDSLAIIGLEKSLAINPDQPEILQLVGDTYYKNKKFAKAIDIYKMLMSKRKKTLSQDYYSIGRAYYYNNQLEQSDSAFTKLIEMQPNMTVGYLWEARTKSNLDSTSEQGLAKPYFEMLIEKASSNPEKSKNDLVEAYEYLGYYYYLKSQKEKSMKEIPTSKSYYEKLIALKPEHQGAKDALEIIKKIEAQGIKP